MESRSNGKNLGSFTEDERLHINNSTQSLQSPCYIHSRLDSVLESSRRDQSYFEAQHNNNSMPSIQQKQQDGIGAQMTATTDGENGAGIRSPSSSTNRNITGTKYRPEPRHRGAQGAVEPESESDGEDGSDASTSRNSSSASYSHSSSGESENESDRVRSLTRQLAETAVGVREMSKQLGRATVKSTIQSVLIITKARDNHLIKLTRELAIWLMNTPRNGKESGLIVYVDAQLRQSKRFDAEGIKQTYPHLFVPSLSRRQSAANANIDADSEDPFISQSSSNNSSTSTSRMGSISHSRDDSHLRYWTSDMCSRSPHLFDFVVTLGGDGTVLFCSWLFQRIVPPVMPFALGSLGFLTNFDYSDYKKVLESALDTGIRVNLRMRFTATVYRAIQPSSTTARRAIRSGKTGEIIMRNIQEGGWNQIESPLPAHGDLRGAFTEATGVSTSGNGATEDRSAPKRPQATGEKEEEEEERQCKDGVRHRKRDKEVMCFTTRPVETFEVLNDLVVDRGPSPYVSLLEVFGDEHHMTTAQADGLCISTPTGSTAYSLSAGGSLVHPEIPAILITPICPHTLSFRPMLLPDSMELRIAVPYNSRSTAWASFDGRGRVELRQGDHIKVTASRYPFPTVCAQNQSIDWFESISRTLKWNERQRQKSFVVVEEGGDEQVGKIKKKKRRGSVSSTQANSTETKEETKAQVTFAKKGSTIEEDDEDEENEQEQEQEVEEKFDIDDSSTVATRASSPDSHKLHYHHHHHHHHHHRRASGNSSAHSRNGSISDLLSVPPLSSGSKEALNRLRPLTSTNNSAKKDNKSFDGASGRRTEAASSLKEQSQSATSTLVESRESSADPTISLSRTSSEEVDSTSSTSTSNPQRGVVQPSSRSLLDSPDRFGLAGPPQPPRALSDRHLATADFRLDGGKAEDAVSTTSIAEGGDKAGGEVSQKSSDIGDKTTLDDKLATTIQTARKAGALGENETSETSSKKTPPIFKSDGPSKKANKLYKKLRGKSKSSRSNSQDTRVGDNLDLNRSSSSGTGAALVVYGQDQSDSDSTEEG